MFAKHLGVLVVASLVATGSLLGGDAKKDKKDLGAAELKKVQGTWKFTAHAHGDKVASPEQLAKMKITFAGAKFSVTIDGKVVQAGTQKLDPTKKPAQLDSKVTEGEGKGGTMLGIYEMKGNTIKVCFDPSGKERPTSFTAKEGQFSATIEREKK